jgi:hypothetical protein
MILYHTSDIEIRKPDIHHGRKNADFGWGFYLSPDREFTYRWARENAVVNKYEFDDTGLDIFIFDRNTDWFRYIFQNRRAKDELSSDVVIGPIANDTIFDTLGILSSGYLKPEEALQLLMIGPEYTQVAIKTKKAIEQLHFISSERINRMDKELLKAEQDAYQEALAAEIEAITGDEE